MSAFAMFFNDKITITKKDDSYTSKPIPGMVKANVIHFNGEDLPEGIKLETGDFIDKILPNNAIKRYVVIEPNFKEGFLTIPSFYEAKIRAQQ